MVTSYQSEPYPVQFSVDFPDRPLDRLTSFFRIFTVIPIGLSMTGAILAGKETGLVIAAASGLVQLTRFWKFDRKPAIADGDLDAAAMIHDARKVLSLD